MKKGGLVQGHPFSLVGMHISTPLILSHNLLQYPLRGNRLVVQDNLVSGHVCFND